MNSISDAEFFGNENLKWLHKKIVIEKEIRWVKKFISQSNPKLLDIGCGTGWTTAVWQEHGFAACGLEPSNTRGELCQNKYGIKIYHNHIENLNIEEKFDLIILRHVLEHIENPKAALEKVRSFLKKDGVLLIVIPNINSIGRFIFQEHFAWILPWHLHFYNPNTLALLLKKTGYEKLKIYQMPSPLWYPEMFKEIFGHESAVSRFLNRRSRIFNLFLCSPIVLLGMLLNLNDNMTLIFRKS